MCGVCGQEVVRDRVLEQVEPEERELGEDAALVGDAGGEDVVEGGDAVGGDEEKLVVAEVVDVAHLAAGGERKIAEAGLEKGLAHWLIG